MKLLNFDMPPISRISWVSKEVKDEWEPKFVLASNAYKQLEIQTVIQGLREYAIIHIKKDEYIDKLNYLAENNLVFLPTKIIDDYSGFTHKHKKQVSEINWKFYGVVTNNIKKAKEFANLLKENNHKNLGILLNYPDCCIDFFEDTWNKGYIDPVWQQTEKLDDEYIINKNNHFIKINHKTPYESNILLKYIGLRLIPHIPCSLDCKQSHNIAKEWLKLGKELKIEGIEELEYFLKLPVEWDCLKGIAYVSTPLFKIETSSITCYPKYVVQKMGTVYPFGLPRGLKFPYRMEQSIPKDIILKEYN